MCQSESAVHLKLLGSLATHKVHNRDFDLTRKMPLLILVTWPLVILLDFCCLLFSSAAMFKNPLWQTVWAQIRLLQEQSDLGSHCLLLYLILSNVRQIFAANDFSRRHFQMHFFLGALRVKMHLICQVFYN